MPHLLIIGSPSLDTLHFNHRTEKSTGGAGLYTALAAHRSRCTVSMVGPRPDPVPEPLLPFAAQLEVWLGPVVPLDEVPRFEIAHDGDQATYLDFYAGAEEWFDAESLPEDLSIYDGVHITSLGVVEQQLRFVDACRERHAKMISLGCYLGLVKDNPQGVRTLLDQTDVYFMNEFEAVGLFGSLDRVVTKPGKLLFITLGREGAIVVQGDHQTNIPAVPASVLDPTGAGDTFCGATLAHLLQGEHPVMAARQATALAAEMIEHVGPTALLFEHNAPGIPLDARVKVDEGQVKRIAEVVKSIPDAGAFNFVSDYHPPVGHPMALDYFFLQTLHQFSFWETESGRYAYPLIGTIDGHACKGSTYLSFAYLRPLDRDPAFFSPARQAETTLEETLALYRADDGTDPMPAVDLHLEIAQAYGKDMCALGLTPQAIVDQANRSDKPLKTFLSILDHIAGYKEDPYRKKANLLALILFERPEHFLKRTVAEEIRPVIDYHAMRFCLRTGLVEIVDATLREQIGQRALVSVEEEGAVRYACYVAVQRLKDVSGLSMGAVDNITFGYNRKHCPEMTEPICEACMLDPACAHRKHLFQPVLRTTFY
jgi:sugar/nucleoside kinase (ribokinase family)